MARPNAVLSSPYQKEIEEFILEGKPNSFIAEWLKKKEAPISAHALGRYRNNEFNVQVKAREKYNAQKSKERLEKGSDEIVDDIEYIDTFLSEIDPSILSEVLAKDQVNLIPKLLTTKYKILGQINDGPTVNVGNTTNISFSKDNQNRILEEEGYDK